MKRPRYAGAKFVTRDVKFPGVQSGNMAEDSALPKGVPFKPGRLGAAAKLKQSIKRVPRYK